MFSQKKTSNNRYYNSTIKTENSSCFTKYAGNITDQFAVSNNKAKLTYPVGLVQNEELSNINTPTLMATGEPWFTISPINSFGTSNNVVFADTDGSNQGNFVGIAYDTRPVVSLKAGVQFAGGTGSEADSWVVK